MQIDLSNIAAIVGSLTVIGAPIIWVLRKILIIVKRLDENQCDIEESKKERKVLLNGTLACLKGLHEQGCNGPVTKAIEELEKHLIEK